MMYKFSEFADSKNNLRDRGQQKIDQNARFKRTYESVVNGDEDPEKEEVKKTSKKERQEVTREVIKGTKKIHKEQEGSNPDKDLDIAMSEKVEILGKLIKISNGLDPRNINKILESYKNSKEKYWYYMIEKNEEFHFIKNNEQDGVDMKFFVENLINYYLKNNKVTENIKTMSVIGNNNFVILKQIPPKFRDMIKNDLVKLLSRED